MRSRALPPLLAVLVVATSLFTPAAPAAAGPPLAAPTCASSSADKPVKIAQIGDWAESIIVDDSGRMFVTTNLGGRVFRIDHPGAVPEAITPGIGATGGLLVRPSDGKLLVGTGNDLLHSLTGDLFPQSRILVVDPDTGAVTTFASGLPGIDGMAMAPDGTIYATTLGGRFVTRVSADGTVTRRWAKVTLGNGIAVSPDGRFVYVVQTTANPALLRIPVATGEPTILARPPISDSLGLPDGLTLDSVGRPLVATHAAGQVWRLDSGHFCALSRSPLLSTQVTYGHGTTGFSAGRLFRAGADGGIHELPAGFDRAAVG